MPNHFFARKQQKHLLKQAKQAQAARSLVGEISYSPRSVPNYQSAAGAALGCLLLLAAVTSAESSVEPVSRAVMNSRRIGNRNPLSSTDICPMPVKINPTNTLTIYHASQHFFSEFVCNYCDDGKFYADRHAIQPEGRHRMNEVNKGTNSVRDEYFNADHEKLTYVKVHLSDKKAKKVMSRIRSMHKKLDKREITFQLFDYNCIDYAQNLYAATGASGYFADQFGTANLFGVAGAMAYYKHTDFSYDTLFKMMYIFFHDPANAVLPEDFKESQKPCLLYDVNRTKPYYYSRYAHFQPHQASCKTTPTGEQILSDNIPPLIPDCEVIRGKCSYPKGHVPEYTAMERFKIRIEPLLRLVYG